LARRTAADGASNSSSGRRITSQGAVDDATREIKDQQGEEKKE
jgi:hypothetical protein